MIEIPVHWFVLGVLCMVTLAMGILVWSHKRQYKRIKQLEQELRQRGNYPAR